MQQIAAATVPLPVPDDARIDSRPYERTHARKQPTSPENALEFACAAVTEVLGVKYSFFYEAGPAGIGFTHCSGVQEASLVAEKTLHQSVFSECIRRNVPEYYSTEVGDSICIPVTGQSGRLGVLTAHAAGRHAFADRGVEFLFPVAGVIAMAFERIRRLRIVRNEAGATAGRVSPSCPPCPAC